MCDQKVGAISCCGVTAVVFIVVLAMIIDSVHVIDEGTVGIYYVQGALQVTKQLSKRGDSLV